MIVRSLGLRNFRNYERLDLAFRSRRIVFFGANGQGKTNILEAIYLLSNAKGFRTSRLGPLVRWEEEVARITGEVEDNGVAHSLAIGIQGNKKHLFHGDSPLNTAREYVGHLDTFLLVPQDIDLIEGSPKRRRDAVDRGIFQIRPLYLEEYSRYHQALSQRNALMKTRRRPDEAHMAAWEEAMASAGAAVTAARHAYLEQLSAMLGTLPEGLRDLRETYALAYKPSIPGDAQTVEGFLALLQETRERDFELGYTFRGPHRDEVDLLINGVAAKDHASIGQRRSLCLMFLLAALGNYVEQRRQWPVLLVDDLELDARRCGIILEYLDASCPEMQILFTTTDREKFRFPGQESEYFHIEGGAATAV